MENQLIYSSILILLLGIPHGAIDHVLFFKKRKMSQLKFYSYISGISFLFVILWHILPVISLILFLLISAFHFGESQFADIFFKKSLRFIFYFFWDYVYLSTLMYYNEMNFMISLLILMIQLFLTKYIIKRRLVYFLYNKCCYHFIYYCFNLLQEN